MGIVGAAQVAQQGLRDVGKGLEALGESKLRRGQSEKIQERGGPLADVASIDVLRGKGGIETLAGVENIDRIGMNELMGTLLKKGLVDGDPNAMFAAVEAAKFQGYLARLTKVSKGGSGSTMPDDLKAIFGNVDPKKLLNPTAASQAMLIHKLRTTSDPVARENIKRTLLKNGFQTKSVSGKKQITGLEDVYDKSTVDEIVNLVIPTKNSISTEDPPEKKSTGKPSDKVNE